MIAILISSILLVFESIILGTAFSKIFNIKCNNFEKVLIGFVFLNTISSIVSVFQPVNLYTLLWTFLCSLLIFLFIKPELKKTIDAVSRKKNIIILSSPILITGLLLSINSPLIYDSGLYHIQSIKWIEEYSTIPGLANLHSRFGFNPNIFTLFALTSLTEIFGQEIFSINFTLFSLITLYFIRNLYTEIEKGIISSTFIFNVIILFVLLSLIKNLSSPTPDFIATAFPLFVFSNYMNITYGKEEPNFKNYIPILIIIIYSLTVKLATAPLLLFFLLIFKNENFTLKHILLSLAIILFVTVPWIIRNIILTGWLIYPFPYLDMFTFDWRVPLSKVLEEKTSITGWARYPGDQHVVIGSMPIIEWFPIWIKNLAFYYKVLFIISILSPLISLLLYLTKKIHLTFQQILIISTSFLGVIFWFLLAPDIRFGKAFLVVSAFYPLTFLKFNFKNFRIRVYKYFLIFTSTFLLFTIYFLKENEVVNKYFPKISNHFLLPKLIEKPRTFSFIEVKYGHEKIYVPVEDDRCYDLDIPCTPSIENNFKLRGKNIKSGFKN